MRFTFALAKGKQACKHTLKKNKSICIKHKIKKELKYEYMAFSNTSNIQAIKTCTLLKLQ